LMHRAYLEGHAGLALSVSERNTVAVRLYEHLGFEHVGRTPTGLLTMVWSAVGSDSMP
jgi:ribosomal protein S18 acetylase RimI-like enzyme